MNMITLWRPVGPAELALIQKDEMRSFPERLAEQPIFYPVTNHKYACQIARDWNVKASGSGYVTEFDIPSSALEKWPEQIAGSKENTELWVPAQDLDDFNKMIIGPIRVIESFS